MCPASLQAQRGWWKSGQQAHCSWWKATVVAGLKSAEEPPTMA